MYRSGQESTRESCQQEVSDIAYCLSAQPIRAAMLPCCHGGALPIRALALRHVHFSQAI